MHRKVTEMRANPTITSCKKKNATTYWGWIMQSKVERTYMFQLKTPDLFTRIQWYTFQVALLIIFIATLIKFVLWLLR